MSSPFNVSPPPATGTSSVCLGNYISQPTKFKVIGLQGGILQTVVVTVKPYNYQWSQGWDTGPDKIVTVSVDAISFSRVFSPFTACANVALYRR